MSAPVPSREPLFHLKKRLEEQAAALKLLAENQLLVPLLTLVYSSIDVFASLTREDPEENVLRSEFVGWVDNYLLPVAGSTVTAIDLYAARCGMLHTLSPSSKLSRSGGAQEIFYVMTPEAAVEEKLRIGTTHRVMEVPKFLDAYTLAAEKFFVAAGKNSALGAKIIENACHVFRSE